jgi:hypothetical protein
LRVVEGGIFQGKKGHFLGENGLFGAKKRQKSGGTVYGLVTGVNSYIVHSMFVRLWLVTFFIPQWGMG